MGEDEDYDDGTIDLYRQLDDPDSASAATQKAIDITTEFVLERLSISVVGYFKELFKNMKRCFFNWDYQFITKFWLFSFLWVSYV